MNPPNTYTHPKRALVISFLGLVIIGAVWYIQEQVLLDRAPISEEERQIVDVAKSLPPDELTDEERAELAKTLDSSGTSLTDEQIAEINRSLEIKK